MALECRGEHLLVKSRKAVDCSWRHVLLLLLCVTFAAWCAELLLDRPLERFSRSESGSNAFRCRQYSLLSSPTNIRR
ncbi:hypothetical protein L207DRAFT_81763 [Hyaloscypha variabilis F]|uniref:Uncharacterized protein n=1 Tax=Hyaloscypha variabilis (strain UAMH 11265 / GT02V1 / F) TaxID=1149755 RepID=A0A2J6RD76_HYAVF|nr:hypothetical protein L207DRAFT_81763 [Hyaloscypha variabilis F]